MSATTTEAPAQEHTEISRRRGLGVLAMSTVAMVAGLALRYFGSMIGDDTGAMVGIFVASIGLIFIFPALQTYLLASRYV
jgi:hypothetical protein